MKTKRVPKWQLTLQRIQQLPDEEFQTQYDAFYDFTNRFGTGYLKEEGHQYFAYLKGEYHARRDRKASISQ